MLPDDSIDRGQPHPRSLSAFLRREKRFKDVIAHFRTHSYAGIGYGKHHVGSRNHSGIKMAERIVQKDHFRFNLQQAAVGHGVARVQAEVHQHLLHLRGLCFDRR